MSILKLVVVLVGGANPQALPVPSMPIELSGGNQVLEVKLDTTGPRGTLRRDGKTYTMIDPKLTLTATAENKTGVTAEYRLKFAIDTCAHAKPADPPAACAYPDGAAPPVKLQLHDVLITRRRTASGERITEDFLAACVPTSGEGPTCRLTGVFPPLGATASR